MPFQNNSYRPRKIHWNWYIEKNQISNVSNFMFSFCRLIVTLKKKYTSSFDVINKMFYITTKCLFFTVPVSRGCRTTSIYGCPYAWLLCSYRRLSCPYRIQYIQSYVHIRGYSWMPLHKYHNKFRFTQANWSHGLMVRFRENVGLGNA